MLSKLLKYDLRKNMRWLWILFASSIVLACITRGFSELAQNIMFFKIVNILLDSLFYTLLANALIHPFLRNFLNFSKTLYGDEAYLTHTLPVTKNQIINSKFLTALIEILLGFACVIISLLIRFASSTMFKTFKFIFSTLIIGKFSLFLILSLIILLITIEFLMFISIIYFSIILANKSQERKGLKAFLITALISLIALTFLSLVMIVVLLINDVNLTSSTLILTSTTLTTIMLAGIITYTFVAVLFYFLAKKEFNKGVNVD